ncbi:DUF397 domain-containing protein [Streptomyces sp. LX-29]|uniref:DUF397 domain-containing protein n=1 Tax=Streptomyces sp. LX-29 TaxID=2900152 RepID=UPI00240E7144|nr:DUF397 domain-containing protein [Streptomyces sp. LX-29]WFB07841.1 DUF397 domain-containing protein [Streptomyces sp. LX-29]
MNGQTKAITVAPKGVWFKSSYSGPQGGTCVEISPRPTDIAIRDSKNKTGPILVVPTPAWAAFVDGLRAGGLGSSGPGDH